MAHDPDVLRGLLERVKAVEGYDRELDADLCAALEGGEIVWKTANFTMDQHPAIRRPSRMHVGGFANEPVPLVTMSLDAAVGLARRVLKPRNIVVNLAGQPRASIVMAPGVDFCFHAEGELEAPVALCVALLTALIAQQETSDVS